MNVRVQKWGNSLALRIPKAVAEDAGFREDTPVDVSVVKGKLIVRALRRKRPTLKQLLREVTDENLHGEWDTGPAVGREVW